MPKQELNYGVSFVAVSPEDYKKYKKLRNENKKLRLKIENQRKQFADKVIFTNSIGEEFTKEYIKHNKVYAVIKSNYTIMNAFVNPDYLGDTEQCSEVFKTREGAEKWRTDNIVLVDGEVYYCECRGVDGLFRKVSISGYKTNTGSIYDLGDDLYEYIDVNCVPTSKFCGNDEAEILRQATQEEKQKLIQAEKENGYEWNGKELVKIEKFRNGDFVVVNKSFCALFKERDKDTTTLMFTSKGELVFKNSQIKIERADKLAIKELTVKMLFDGYRFDEEKKEFVGLELGEVYYKPTNRDDVFDVASVRNDILGSIDYGVKDFNYIELFRGYIHSRYRNDNEIEVSKQAFIRILKEYKK